MNVKNTLTPTPVVYAWRGKSSLARFPDLLVNHWSSHFCADFVASLRLRGKKIMRVFSCLPRFLLEGVFGLQFFTFLSYLRQIAIVIFFIKDPEKCNPNKAFFLTWEIRNLIYSSVLKKICAFKCICFAVSIGFVKLMRQSRKR